MKNLRWVRVAQRTLQGTAQVLRDMDANESGVDDALAVALNYLSGAIDAIVRQIELPRIPKELLSLVGTRIRIAPSVMRVLVVPLGIAEMLLINAYEYLRDAGHVGRAMVLQFGADLIGAILAGDVVPAPTLQAVQAY